MTGSSRAGYVQTKMDFELIQNPNETLLKKIQLSLID